MAKSLFITYDGLTDPLGQSQILPYLTGLAKLGHDISILSCEKKDRYDSNNELIKNICKAHNISWHHLFFHTSPPVLSKYYDLYSLKKKAEKLYKQNHYDIIHCRSYLSANIGLMLKKKYGVKFLFDMRGFWVDERIDGGIWNKDKWFFKIAYKAWKKKEASFVKGADHIISLTEAARNEIKRWPTYSSSPITVIPCSADMNLFTIQTTEEKNEARNMIGISKDAFVISYLGSLGTWYLVDEMLDLFKKIQETLPNSYFLVLTPDKREIVLEKAKQKQIAVDNIIIRFAKRQEVPVLMKASDISISFIKDAYSKIASSPTKLGELLAMNIPVICNDIGDVATIINNSKGGFIVKDFSTRQLADAVKYALLHNKGTIDRQYVENYYSLENAIQSYDLVYESLII